MSDINRDHKSPETSYFVSTSIHSRFPETDPQTIAHPFAFRNNLSYSDSVIRSDWNRFHAHDGRFVFKSDIGTIDKPHPIKCLKLFILVLYIRIKFGDKNRRFGFEKIRMQNQAFEIKIRIRIVSGFVAEHNITE